MTIFLVRHASAGRRGPSSVDDDRVLDTVGRDQALAIATALCESGITQVLSSKAIRCVQTVAPLAHALGLDVDIHPVLWEGQSAGAAIELIDSLIAKDVTAVLSSHGDIIPGTLNFLASRGVELASNGCSKGSIWTLHAVGGAITSTDYQTTT